nr:alcohol dehydrogenase catalytic domain-containing protein [Actinospica durhamensis]
MSEENMNEHTMRAVTVRRFGGSEVLTVEEVARPVPLPTEVLVRVHAAGINPVDCKTRGGTGMAGVLGEPPFTVGWDVSGVVEEVGFGVTTLKVCDEVYGMPWFPRAANAYAEYVTAPARSSPASRPPSTTFTRAPCRWPR